MNHIEVSLRRPGGPHQHDSAESACTTACPLAARHVQRVVVGADEDLQTCSDDQRRLQRWLRKCLLQQRCDFSRIVCVHSVGQLHNGRRVEAVLRKKRRLVVQVNVLFSVIDALLCYCKQDAVAEGAIAALRGVECALGGDDSSLHQRPKHQSCSLGS